MRRIPPPESRNTLLCLAVLAQLLFASGLHAEKKWLRLTSPHFELFTTEAEKEARKGILHFETLQDLLTGPLGLPPSETPVTIIVLDSPKAFREFRPSGYPRATSVPGENRDLIVMSSLGKLSMQAAAYQYVHLLLHRSGAKLPLWLEQGLTYVYGSVRRIGGKVMVGDVITTGVRTNSAAGGWVPLEMLTSFEGSSQFSKRESLPWHFTSQCWYVVHLLALSDEYRPQFSEFTRRLTAGESLEEGLDATYGKSVEDLKGDLVWHQRMALKAVTFDVAPQQKAPTVEPADPAEVDLARAEALYLDGHGHDADEIYSRLLEAYPDNCELHESVGYRRRQAQDEAAARQHFQKAMELDSGNGKMYLDYAMLLRKIDAPDEQVIPVLNKAVMLMPENVDARFNLGLAYLRREEYRDALNHLGRIRKITPERAFPYFHGLSVAYRGVGNKEQSLAAAQRAREYASSPEQIDAAKKLFSTP